MIRITSNDLIVPNYFECMFKDDARINRYEVIAIPYVQTDGTIAINYELVFEVNDMPDTYEIEICIGNKSAEDCIKGINDYLSSVDLPEDDFVAEILKVCSLVAQAEIGARQAVQLAF